MDGVEFVLTAGEVRVLGVLVEAGEPMTKEAVAAVLGRPAGLAYRMLHMLVLKRCAEKSPQMTGIRGRPRIEFTATAEGIELFENLGS